MKRLSEATKLGVVATSLVVLSLLTLSYAPQSLASSQTQSSPLSVSGNVRVDIVSSAQINGIAGQFVTISANFTNPSSNETLAGVAYISIVDVNTSQPIDLEDWSASKGVNISSIAPGQSVTLDWNLRLVKAGSYTVDVLFNGNGDLSPPATSQRISLQVAPKINLNPGNVLPIAFGVPALLVIVFALINYRRGKKTGVYG
jgi:hypothetical protein